MQEAFHRALFPPALQVMSCALPALSLWHLAALHALRSPFLATQADTPVVIGDLQLALRVCSTAPLAALNVHPRATDILTRWRYRHTWQRHAKVFAQWLRLQQITPEMWQRVDEGLPRHITAPIILSKIAALMALGFTHAEAWSLSPGYAEWLLLSHAERTTAGLKFVTDADRVQMQQDALAPALTDAEEMEIAQRELPPAQREAWLAARAERLARAKSQPMFP